jgi:pimeloyl-ACP methyl ester carboxylesterase
MLSYRREYLAVLVLTMLVMMDGCGGHGGGNSTPSNQPLPQDPSASQASFQVNPGEAVTKTVGDVEVSVPANAFSQQATVTIKLTNPANKPDSMDVDIVGSEIEISSTTMPAGNITITTPCDEQPGLTKSSLSSLAHFLYCPISYVNGAWKMVGELVGNQEKIKTTIRPEQLIFLGAAYSLKMALAKVETDSPYATETGLPLIAGSVKEDNCVILVHGINSNEESVKTLGEVLVQKGIYKSARSFAYDWRLPTDFAASQLKELIEACFHNHQVDLIGHSRGGLICRYACEVLSGDKLVKKLVLVCTPNEGSKWDSATDFLSGLQDGFFNTPNASGFPLVDTPAVQELTKNSEVIRTLKTSRGHKNNIDYYLFATLLDSFVEIDSALATGTDLESFTTGNVKRVPPMFTGHSGLINNGNGIEKLIENIQD